MLEPAHIYKVPVLAGGTAFTVTVATDVQPHGSVYVILAVPAVRPVTRPVPRNTGATLGSLLVHVPPGMVCERVVVCPTHIESVPVGGAGTASTVAITNVAQPVGNV